MADVNQAAPVPALPGIAQAAVKAGGNEDSDGNGILSKNIGLPALIGLVTGVQALATFTVLALPTLAIKAAPDLGVGPEAAGYQISVIYSAAACISGMSGLFVRRYGAALVSLVAMAFCAAGLLGVASGHWGAAILGSLTMGAAYGLTNPAASHLLLRYAPPQHQNLIFALKQTGVPLGGILAALLLPALEKKFGWQLSLVAGTGLIAALCLMLWLARHRLDADRDPSAKLTGGLLKGVRVVVANPVLRSLAVMGLTYASFQFCLFTFLITMLVKDFGWSLVEAGGIATLLQVGGALGRIAWSVLADRIGHGLWVLLVIGLASAAFAGLLGLAEAAWPVPLLTAVLFGFGFCLVGWNGLWMAEIARTSNPGEVGLATGGVLVFTYIGVMLGPAAFALIYRCFGSYATTYAAFGTLSLIGAAALLSAIRHRAQAGG